MKLIWKFKDGVSMSEYESFPYAFRTMHNAVCRGVEKGGRKYDDMMKQMFIISPLKDRNGDPKSYSYTEASAMAKTQGLLDSDGKINSREFKNRK